MIKNHDKQQKRAWRQINFRSVDNMLGVQFLHDLYNRHHPYVNSLRFRNTVLVVKGREVTSYAPEDEWQYLAEWFGERFLRGDEDVYESIYDELINFKKPKLMKLLKRFEEADFSTYDDIGICLALLDLHYLTLGEIYKVNLVQIEHALTYAINTRLSTYFPEENERNEAFAKLIQAEEPTVAGREEVEFIKIVNAGVERGIMSLSETDGDIYSMVEEHHKKYAFVHSAYGANPYTVQDYVEKYNDLASLGKDTVAKKMTELVNATEKVAEEKKPLIEMIKDDPYLLKNIEIFTKVGVLRDNNKALMGTTTKWRGILLEEVSKRSGVPREDINMYFIREICDLIKHGVKLSREEIEDRRDGFGMTRMEGLYLDLAEAQSLVENKDNTITTLTGMCASAGLVKGTVKIIKSSKDVGKIEHGDIMVAPGTDFDLINAMQKSGAIVTEEGGILSHASVVSRELNIPCVIAVKDATTILKDGMQVEVDATNGTINIL